MSPEAQALALLRDEWPALRWRSERKCMVGTSRDGSVVADCTRYGVDLFLDGEYRWTFLASDYRKRSYQGVRGLRAALRDARRFTNEKGGPA